MRDLVLIVASSSSIVIPPSSSPFPNPSHSHHSTKSKPKPSFTPSGKQSSQLGSSRSPAPLLSAARWDTTLRRRGRLKYYANLASKLAEQGRFHDFLMVAESVVGSGLEPARFVSLLNAELLSKGILLMLSEGNVSSIVEVMSGVKKLGIDRFELFDKEAIARECRRIVKSSGGLEEFVNLTEALAGFGFSINELVEPSEIVELCVNKRNPSAAVRYACTSSASQIIFCSVIHEFGKKRDLASALTVFEASKKEVDSPNLYAYRRMIDVCGVCGDYMKARSIYEELLNQKATPNVYVINSLMNVNSHDLSYTLHIYKQMQSLGVKADIATYNILLKSCCLVARVDLAKEIYREVQQLESKGALKLDAFTYSTIVKVFADAKMWATALEVKEDMAAAGVIPNHITWSSLINACASAGLVDQSLKLFDEMLNAGCQPNSQCCNTLLHACVESCQFDRAFRLFQSWKAIGFENENLNLKSNSNSNSLRFSMRTPFKPMVSTYNILMKACGTDYNRAKALMDEMKNIGLTPNIISWSILISICGRKGSVKGALKILKSMREAGIQPDVVAYTAAIKACVEGRNMKFAFSLFTEMKKNKVRPNLVTYNTLLRARSRYGSLQEVQQCLAIYQDMRKAGYRANDYYLKQLIEEWCEEVIQNNNQNKSHFTSSTRIEFSESRSLFLEKVAELLQKDHDECLLIDLQGLTKVEARIVVLAVLRMIKENYSPGYTIKEDMCIILDIPGTTAKHDSEIQDAITKLLQDELGLEVISSGPPLLSKKIDLEITQKSNLKISSRRPRVLQRLRITKESLYHWLQRRTQHHPLQG